MYQPQQMHSGSAVVYTAQGQPVAFSVLSPVYESYRSRQSRIAGAILIITGVLSIIFNAVGIHLFEVFGFIGHGIWCGVLFIVAGAIGISAARKNRCLVIAFMVLAIIAASVALVMFILSVFGAIIGRPYYYRYSYKHHVGIMNALMAVMSVFAASAAIWGSVLGCKVTCCGRTVTGTVVGSSQPVVFFSTQPQQAYFGIPQVDPVITSSVPGGPPSYELSVHNQPMPQQQTGPAYSPTIAAASAPYPSGYGGGDTMPPMKM